MRKSLKKLYELLMRPFTQDFYFLFIMVFFVSVADVVGFICYGRIVFAGIMALHGYVMCYVIALVCLLIPSQLSKYVKKLFVVLAIVNFFIDVSVHITCTTNFTTEMVAIIYGTNINESIEFIDTYFSWQLLVFFICGLGLYWLFSQYRKYLQRLGNSIFVRNILLLVVLIGGIYLFCHKPSHWDGVFLGKIISFCSYKTPPDMDNYKRVPEINIISTDDLPKNIVLIIGESFSKFHSSLYGYEQETNPCLQKMVNDSSIIVYSKAESPATTTINSFMAILSGSQEFNDDWYKRLTLMEVMSGAGYQTIWISNQSPTGVVDNVISEYSDLCDTTIWTGSKYKGYAKMDYDEEILKTLISLEGSEFGYGNLQKKFTIIHLMGSHPAFRERYPDSFKVFSEQDYHMEPKMKRQLIAEYDNTIIYNDSVVASLFDYFEEYESMVFYFSDHGLDVFYTSDRHCGHARTSDVTSITLSKQIPFVVYLSPSFKTNFTEITSLLSSQRDLPFYTCNMMSFILDLIGLEYHSENVITQR